MDSDLEFYKTKCLRLEEWMMDMNVQLRWIDESRREIVEEKKALRAMLAEAMFTLSTIKVGSK